MSNRANDGCVQLIVAGLLIMLALCVWPISSYFEAKAFNSATGKDVSTWDAMFIELRVQDEAK